MAFSLLLASAQAYPPIGVIAAVAPLQVQAADPNVRCAANRATSVAISFERVDLRGAERAVPREDYRLLHGPRMLVVVEDSTTWPAVWRVAADSMKPFPV